MAMHLPTDTDDILHADEHLIQSFADLNDLKNKDALTVVTAAEGYYVTESNGNQLIDGIGGLWCVNVGHKRQEIIDAISRQLNTLDYYSTFYNFTHPTAAKLADKVAQLAPGDLNHVYFANSGSVANDSAIRILHHYNNRLGRPHKKKILSRIGAYHGSTHLSVAMTTPAYSKGWDSASELVHHIQCPHFWKEGGEMTEAEFLDSLVDDLEMNIHNIGAENIAAFIAEPVMGAGGVIMAPQGYHARMAKVCADNEIKYISDEVVTSFGRLGHFFASKEMFGITPDIITTAKGLTSGYQPLSATILSDEIYEVISRPGEVFLHGMTYSGHPAAAAAGLANIALMEQERIPEQVRHTGKVFENLLKTLDSLELVGEVRGSHFMIGIEFIKDKANKIPFAEQDMVGMKVAQAAQKRGLIARPLGNCLILSPPLILDEPIINTIYEILRDSIIEVSARI
ncbi:L-Lysine-8-amino-7-oxononanoate aminotransferase [Vibrio aerogenes CECT 7868]|uniref:L-Lysine-8-amino-7-oxononanoate aminotransferase n=1 Tax=Vibrio aerogenes CECT 7868 TaxID=1216006 RepID=A0A1M6AGG8_9VIBR|nr:aminotransferase class III-fold pyridoxal phosphate-dependent enzyme [Vibrio aerogenes]SHI35522.1 L-Lysine-8-amino-7-oxononanoate aminotransferase [Vibrio aerogenes CECT 7868]